MKRIECWNLGLLILCLTFLSTLFLGKKKKRKWHRCLLKQSSNGLFFSIIVTILRKWTSYMVMYDVCLLKRIFLFFFYFFPQKGEIHKMLIVVERKSYKSDKDIIQNHFTLRVIRDELSFCRITMLSINWKDYRKNQFPILVNKLLLWIVLLVPGKEKGGLQFVLWCVIIE